MSKIVKIDREKIKWEKKEKQKQEMKKQIIINLKQKLLDWNFKLGDEPSNKFATITCVIKKWEQEYNRETDKTDEEKVCALYDDFNNFWNGDYEIGKATINYMDFVNPYLMIDAIEDLYDEVKDDELKIEKLVDKLNYVYYKQAEKECIKQLDKHNLDMDYWGNA